MRYLHKYYLILLLPVLFACDTKNNDMTIPQIQAFQGTKTITYNGISVDIVIDKPANSAADVLILYHGTVQYDSLILQAARNTLDTFKSILERKDMMIVSVAYPEEYLLFGDNIKHAEAALLWVKNKANAALGIQVKKIFLAGHSQGGYLVTHLNTMHPCTGVIANGPGPLNLEYRCKLEEDGKIPHGIVCTALYNAYGSTTTSPQAYYQRSLLNFTSGYQSDILFVQGMNDSPIQMYSWPVFKQKVEECADCQGIQFLELKGFGHQALFHSPEAIREFNNFIRNR
jgi:hypothetical protein